MRLEKKNRIEDGPLIELTFDRIADNRISRLGESNISAETESFPFQLYRNAPNQPLNKIKLFWPEVLNGIHSITACPRGFEKGVRACTTI